MINLQAISNNLSLENQTKQLHNHEIQLHQNNANYKHKKSSGFRIGKLLSQTYNDTISFYNENASIIFLYFWTTASVFLLRITTSFC